MSRGHDRERAVKELLVAGGWLVVRAAGSLGICDLVALKASAPPLLIEVKSTAGGPYEHFRPVDREALAWAATIAGADAWLAWWPPRSHLRWFPASAWPTSAKADA